MGGGVGIEIHNELSLISEKEALMFTPLCED